MSADWDKNEIISQGRQAYIKGTSFDTNPYRFTPLSRGGLFKASYWEFGWIDAESANNLDITHAEMYGDGQ